MDNAYRDMTELHAMKIGFLWKFRSSAVDQPNHLPASLAELDQRIYRHLDGLLLQAELAWDICEKTLKFAQPEETFTAALLAFTCGNTEKTAQAVKAGFMNANTFNALVSALEWLPESRGLKWIEPGLSSDDLDYNLLAISVCRLLGHDPGEPLTQLIKRSADQQQHFLLIQCLRLAGELKRTDLKADCQKATTADNTDLRFWGIWSSVLLGERDQALALEPYTQHTNPWQQKAIQLAFRVIPDNTADTWIDPLLHHPDPLQQRCGIKAIAANGRPQRMPDVITAMKNDTLARVAGEAFTLLTGSDIKQQQLTRPTPIRKWKLDNLDDSELDIELEDSKLPWPDADKTTTRWQQHSTDLETESRYFMGKGFKAPTITGHLNHIIASGYQRQRHAAALELALLEPTHPLVNTRAPSQETQ